MGYYTSFKLKGEIDPEFKSWMKEGPTKSEINRSRTFLIATCMLAGGNVSKDNMFNIDKIYKDVNFRLRFYISELKEDWKNHIAKEIETEGKVALCGWEFSKGSAHDTWTDESIEEHFMHNIFMLAVFDAGTPFDDETDKYNRKYEQVTDIVDEIESCVIDMMDHKFVARYRDSEDAIEHGDDTGYEDDPQPGADSVNEPDHTDETDADEPEAPKKKGKKPVSKTTE